MYIFDCDELFVYDKLSNEIKDITEEVKGKLLYFINGTSTVVNDKVINTSEDGT